MRSQVSAQVQARRDSDAEDGELPEVVPAKAQPPEVLGGADARYALACLLDLQHAAVLLRAPAMCLQACQWALSTG